MLNKLMKYDFKYMFKKVTPIYLIFLLLALLNRIAYFLSDKVSALNVPAAFILVLYIVMIIGVPIATFIITIIRYYNNLVKDEGYLMHTLPVSKSNLIMSKLITSMGFMLFSVIVSLIGIFIGCYGVYFDSEVFNAFSKLLSKVDTLLIVLMILSIAISFVMQQLMIYLAISLGQKHNSNRVVYSVIYGIVIYNINQVVSAIILLIPSVFSKKWMEYLENDMPPINILNTYLGISIVVAVALSIFYYIYTTRIMEKKLNLE